MPNIKLSIFVQQWFFDIFLNNKGSQIAIVAFLSRFESYHDIIKRMTNRDSIPSIAEFSRFHNPDILLISLRFLHIVESIELDQKVMIFWIFDSFDVKGEGESVEKV